MTDRDVVGRAAALLGRAVCKSDRGADRGYKPVFITRIRGGPAVNVMLALRPLLGQRRRAQIDRAMLRRSARPMRWFTPPSACTAPMCQRVAEVRALCRTHYKLWWKATRKGRASPYVPLDAPSLMRPETEPAAALSRDDPRSIAWLAGLLEGEGYFGSTTVSLRDPNPYPILDLQMSDEEVVRMAATLVDAVSVRRITPRDPRWSPTFSWRLVGPRAAATMRAVRTYMGQRRGCAIDLALARYRPIRLTAPPATCVVPSCEQPHKSRGLCHKHYMMWMRDRASGCTQRITPLR